MIRHESEYQEAVRRLGKEAKRLADHEVRLKEMNLEPDEVKRALDPLRSFHMQLAEEIESYERIKRPNMGELTIPMRGRRPPRRSHTGPGPAKLLGHVKKTK